jgi:hypothetical protein
MCVPRGHIGARRGVEGERLGMAWKVVVGSGVGGHDGLHSLPAIRGGDSRARMDMRAAKRQMVVVCTVSSMDGGETDCRAGVKRVYCNCRASTVLSMVEKVNEREM